MHKVQYIERMWCGTGHRLVPLSYHISVAVITSTLRGKGMQISSIIILEWRTVKFLKSQKLCTEGSWRSRRSNTSEGFLDVGLEDVNLFPYDCREDVSSFYYLTFTPWPVSGTLLTFTDSIKKIKKRTQQTTIWSHMLCGLACSLTINDKFKTTNIDDINI